MNPVLPSGPLERARLISVRVEDRGHALLRVANCLARRGFRLESCAVAHSPEPGVLSLTLRVDPGGQAAEQVVRQLAKLVDLVSVEDLTGRRPLEWTSALVEMEVPASAGELEEVLHRHRAQVLRRSGGRVVAALSGPPAAVEQALEDLGRLRLRDWVCSGALALAPEPDPAPEGATCVQGEEAR